MTTITRRARQRGQSLAELGIVILLLVVTMLGIIEFGRLFLLSNLITHAARDGARLASVRTSDEFTGGAPAIVEDHVRGLVEGIVGADNLTSVNATLDTSGPFPTVTVTITGSIPYLFNFTGMGLWGETLDFSRSVTFRYESA